LLGAVPVAGCAEPNGLTVGVVLKAKDGDDVKVGCWVVKGLLGAVPVASALGCPKPELVLVLG